MLVFFIFFIMKKNIEKQYLIKIDELFNDEGIYYFLYEGSYFYYEECSLNNNQILELIELINENDYLKRNCNIFINNIVGEYITDGYILYKVQGVKDSLCNLDNIIMFNKLTVINDQNKRDIHNWSKLWSMKMDYFEYQISEIGKDKKLILGSFSYFLGLAETAIGYLNKVNDLIKMDDNDIYCLTHTRVKFPNYQKDFFNPLNFIIDFEIRDLSEYIKSLFYNDEDIFVELDKYFTNHLVGEYSVHLFYARMVYPSTYFDIYESVIHNEKKEDELIKFIEKADDYLNMLRNLKVYLNKYTSIININYI